jgi:hypothetical protein
VKALALWNIHLFRGDGDKKQEKPRNDGVDASIGSLNLFRSTL